MALKGFGSIERSTPNGVALTGKGGAVLLNRTYSVHKFMMKKEPDFVEIPCCWIEKGTLDDRGVGYLALDKDWDGVVPLVHANRFNVRYYGMELDPLEDITMKITSKDGGMFDFEYNDNYLEYMKTRDEQDGTGGCRLERHEFWHVETPMTANPDSGCFVVGKENKERKTIHLTAFIIPVYQTLVVPPWTIHTNDYQRGLWRTYLASGDIDIVDMVRKGKILRARHEGPNKILLQFKCEFLKKLMHEYDLHIVPDDDMKTDDKDKENDTNNGPTNLRQSSDVNELLSNAPPKHVSLPPALQKKVTFNELNKHVIYQPRKRTGWAGSLSPISQSFSQSVTEETDGVSAVDNEPKFLKSSSPPRKSPRKSRKSKKNK